MGSNKIYKICEEVLTVSEDEIKELRDIAAGQKEYMQPLKMATTRRQHELGEHNDKVLDKLLELKEVIESGSDI